MCDFPYIESIKSEKPVSLSQIMKEELSMNKQVKPVVIGTIGAGYARMEYTRYKCVQCAEPTGFYTRSYIGPTRAGLSIIYFLR